MLGRSKQQSALRRELVGVADVAARLSLTAERVRQLAKSGAMPEPLGELGRRSVWDWRDVESWARSEGRLRSEAGESRQVTQPWRQRPPGSLRLVVDELLQWGHRERDVCQVRVWAPSAGSVDPQVVLLGQLQDEVNSVTNNVEQVAMVVAARHLGPQWRTAQFYQYSPASLLDDDDVYLHVTFSVRDLRIGWRRTGSAEHVAAARALGAELLDPDWRATGVEELEHLTGDSPRIWAPGTYTRALVDAAATAPGPLELVWDPARATDLSGLAAEISQLATGQIAALRVTLTEAQRVSLEQMLAFVALDAYETAREDIATQLSDAVITLRPPHLIGEAHLQSTVSRGGLEDLNPHLLWEALMALREALVEEQFDPSDQLDRQRLLLAPGLHGGWVPLHWADAGLDEIRSPRHGWGGPIAIPADLIAGDADRLASDPVERTGLLLDTLATYLAEHWDDWDWHDVPRFTPSTVVSATGPLSRRYLDQITWEPISNADPARVRRLTNGQDLHRAGTDPDGWLVATPQDRRWFVCEWPASGAAQPVLAECRIVADRPDGHASTPVYLVHPDGRLNLLPSAGHRHHGNSFAWGYGGGGPWDFAAAIADVLHRADPDPDPRINAEAIDRVASEYVARPRTPDWQISDLLRQARSRLSAVTRKRSTGHDRDA